MKRLLLAIALAGIGRLAAGDEFVQDFRNQQFNEASLRIIGSQNFIFRDADGLRVELKKDSGDSSNSGVAFVLELDGDCQIEAAVELIDVPTPKAGYGTGAAFLFEDGGPNGASFQSVIMPDGKHLYVTHKFTKSAEGEYKHDAKTFPATASKAVMRMERKGKQVLYLVSDDGGAVFRELSRFPFTDAPIKIAQVYGQTGGNPVDINVRITDFKVVAEAFLRPGQKPRKKPMSMKWLAASLFIGLPILGTVVWWCRRRKEPLLKEDRTTDE